MHSLLDFGEEQALSTFSPTQRGGIGKNQVWASPQDGNLPRIPRGRSPVGNARAIGGKNWAHFDGRIVSQLHGFPTRQQLGVNLTRSEKCAVPPDKSQHASVRRKRRVNG